MDPMETDTPSSAPTDLLPIEQSLEGVLFPTNTRQISRLSHPPPPIDSPVLSAAQTPSKPPSPPAMKEDNVSSGLLGVGVNGRSGGGREECRGTGETVFE
ncbi:hypothetical protein TWF481_011562 [Arthrobotrys musiformis]|uniref:Uncharacterized protein n=1 Tax=Arthrobotrys musiformis TaxID=47236 RepID=A0AAV9W041_9PEZI